MSDTPYDEHFVSWFRAVTPYINAFRGKTFVIAFGGKAVESEFAKTLAYDVNLLVSLGIIAILIPATILGLGIGPAVIVHEGSTLLVVFNALRLLAVRPRT